MYRLHRESRQISSRNRFDRIVKFELISPVLDWLLAILPMFLVSRPLGLVFVRLTIRRRLRNVNS